MHKLWDVVAAVVFACSLLHTLLPPWDGYGDFPRFQKVYKATVYTIGYIALNARSTFHPSLGTDNGSKTSDVAVANAPVDYVKGN